ncbi:MAG: ABC transporter ATP-binding protein [Mycetocola sp.]
MSQLLDGVTTIPETIRADAAPASLIEVSGLVIRSDSGATLVDGVDFTVPRGGTLGIVGESGSGKTLTCRSLLGLLPGGTHVADGDITFDGNSIAGLDEKAWRHIRGTRIASVFQDPASYLNPSLPVGRQLAEVLRVKTGLGRRASRERALELFGQVGLRNADRVFRQYAHELSGGMLQRILIAIALAETPELLIADEATTALDVTVQAEILDLLRRCRDEFGASIVLITHNMGVVADLADRVAVMYQGRVVEEADAQTLFANPQNDYTKKLLSAVPRIGQKIEAAERKAPIDPSAAPVVKAENLRIEYPGRLGRPGFVAVDGVTFSIAPGEVVGLVGESGSGKTTIGRAIAGLTSVTGGSLSVLGTEMNGVKERHFRPLRSSIGFVFQDPASSFNPLLTITECVAEPLKVHRKGMDQRAVDLRVGELLEAVQLPKAFGRRYPHELSGGQRQRASLARALALDPTLLIADEPTSALDVSVQARVLELFAELQSELGFAALFISHDLAVVDILSDRIAVLYHGKLIEEGTGAEVLGAPKDPYTQRLLASLPVPDPIEQAERRRVLATLRTADAAV